MSDIRARKTDRVNRARVRVEFKRSLGPAIVVLLGIALAVFCVVTIVGNLPGGGGLRSSSTVSFEVESASGVVPDRGELRFKGLPAGNVTRVRAIPGGALVIAQLA